MTVGVDLLVEVAYFADYGRRLSRLSSIPGLVPLGKLS
jgi:hypothetical protein